MNICGTGLLLNTSGIIPPYYTIDSIHNRSGSPISITLVGYSSIPNYFMSGNNKLTDVDITKSPNITFIGTYAFQGTRVSIRHFQDKVEYLGHRSFYSAKAPSEIILPKIRRIESEALRSLFSTATVLDLGPNIEYIGTYAFLSDTTTNRNLTTLYCRAINVPVLASTNAFYLQSNLTNIYVPAASVDAYKTATNWSNYASKISAIPT